MKKVLTALDGSENSERTLDFAIEMASISSSELIIIKVIPKKKFIPVLPFPSPYVYYPIVDRSLIRGHDIIKHEKIVEKYLETIKKSEDIEASAILAKGDASEKILEVARDEDPDLIVVGEKDVSGIKKFFFGSVSKDIVKNAERPVLVVK